MAPASIFLAVTYAVIGLSVEPPLAPVPVGIETQVEISEETLDHLRREVDATFFSARVRVDWQSADPLIRVVLQVNNRRRLLFSRDDIEQIRRGVELLLVKSGRTDDGDKERVEHEIIR